MAILPAAVAVIPFALLLGARAAEQGLSPLEVGLMSALVFAGSAQFIAIDTWSQPAPWLILALTTLLVNLRHVLMGASLAGKLSGFPAFARPLATLFMADEIWALAERRALETRLSPAYYAALAGMLYCNWVVWTIAGAILGATIENPEVYGFDFAFTAIFIGLLSGFWRGSQTAWVLMASSGGAVLVKLLVAGPWYILAGAASGIVAASVLAIREDRARRECKV
jgi:4-azaleucine resistance transporter AzlC